ncbi:hypothetical protein [Humibacter ginsenosidimutans]|uniref:Uncharacterized protein n=1 Tax=Humibacter ginsenosidimutans TaxID=2599293 RepID=A0A5B8M584_9MICO|nr:hypothetical protein [Humibacter ginsenosidimutans]QDZ15005.1 hypothetical protein FPZ11_09710 [Humibacter ginsenosidimutans]
MATRVQSPTPAVPPPVLTTVLVTVSAAQLVVQSAVAASGVMAFCVLWSDWVFRLEVCDGDGLGDGELLGVDDDVSVGVLDDVSLGVDDEVSVGVLDGVSVGVELDVSVGVGFTSAAYAGRLRPPTATPIASTGAVTKARNA